MLDYVMTFLHMPGWVTAITGVLGIGSIGLMWFFGLMPIVTAALAPIITAVMNGLIWAVSGMWTNVFWPGLKDILDDWVTVVTVLTMGLVLWFAVLAQNKVEIRAVNFEINQCRLELNKLHKDMPAVDKPTWELPWPWKW